MGRWGKAVVKVALKRRVQPGDVQSIAGSRRTSNSWVGIGTGDLLPADGTLDRKEVMLLRERSSAKWLALVGIYAHDNSKP